MELVIMAAGMGSRFGGLKQLEPIDDNGNFIIDYSIYDAIRCGFDKVVFIIKEEHYDVFRNTVGKRVEDKVETVYVFQDNKTVPAGYKIPEERVKPLGTGHAILCTKNEVNSSFAVINADDFYGYAAFKDAAEFLKNNTNDDHYALVGYKANNTFCNATSVKRGVCYTENNKLTEIIESSLNKNEDGTITATPIDGKHEGSFDIDPSTTVSMNLFAFTKKFMSYLDDYFVEFLNTNKDSLGSAEFFLPTVVTNLIKENKVQVEVLNTDAVWYGMTYKEDKEVVKDSIKKEVDAGIYPESLWA
ncbi:MAG: nucleotidyltransferase [Clostridia bacterium]|nr:nucleotidyltransferase [Clostridia bacterium]